jgi:hypothetical protein
MRPTLDRNSEGLTRKLSRLVKGVLQVIVCASRSVVNVKVKAGLLVMNDAKATPRVLCLKCLVCLAHGSGLTERTERRGRPSASALSTALARPRSLQ